jgi:hypothetical protein
LALGLVLAGAVGGATGACDSDSGTTVPNGGHAAGGNGGGLQGGAGTGGVGFDAGDSDASALGITPQDPVVTVTTGQVLPTVQFQATLNDAPVSAQWLIDRGELGLIDADGFFTPSGNLGGVGTITAAVGSETVSTSVTVNLVTVQNGPVGSDPLPGSGGWGGVGGEGVGPAISNALVALLSGATSSDPSLAWLYPYDKTVWPLGVLPPLLQWAAGSSAVADGVHIHLTSEHYDYQGFFGRPAALPGSAPFVRHPIPPDAWKAATLSSAGGTLTAEIVVAAGGVAYGPITESWTVAHGALKGTVYYQSYGTDLAKNYYGAIGGDGMFGGATLVIAPGATSPALVAGTDGTAANCRVCHSVSLDGSRMVVQLGNDYDESSSYDLQNGYAESPYGVGTTGNLGWVGLSPNGSKGLGNRVPLPGAANPNGPTSLLYDMTTGSALAATGLNDFVTRAGFPVFSVDGARVAFNFYAGPGDATIGAGDGLKLVAMAFDDATNAFSAPALLYQGANPPGWPSFLPTNDAVVFQVKLPGGNGEYFATRAGAKGELWWSDLATGTAAPLERLNGKEGGVSYLPVGGTNHADDTGLSYEPTVCPIPSGGYAWVVFMSRRMYGNVATIDPWSSDPRQYDHTAAATTKKLWVAAVDLNAPPGTDPSHPAFYLPGQELLAGNARGYWVNVPCKADGETCETGDECCGGFCQPDPADPATLICGQQGTECSQEFEHCDTASDCCDLTMECINGMCVEPTPQ